MNDGKSILIMLVLTGVFALIIAGCASPQQPGAPQTTADPAELAKGEELFNKYCAKCHGQKGSGSNEGPPFIDQVYAPGHHADQAFHMAVRNGSKAHHWNFGDMPPVQGPSDVDIDLIVQYVRSLQQEAGIS